MRLRTNSTTEEAVCESTGSPLRLRHNSISNPDEHREASASKPLSSRNIRGTSPRADRSESPASPSSFSSKNSDHSLNSTNTDDDEEEEDKKDRVVGPSIPVGTSQYDELGQTGHSQFDDENNNNTNNTELPDDIPQQGHLFLFCLCDMRIAVIILDTVGIILGVFAIIAIFTSYNDVPKQEKQEDQELTATNLGFYGLLAMEMITIFCNTFGILGAVKFMVCPLQIALFWGFIDGVFCVYDSDWEFLAFHILLFYSHFVLSSEIGEGTMTPELYRFQFQGRKHWVDAFKKFKRRRRPATSSGWDDEGVEVTATSIS